jgi:hypothetical protein
MVEPAGEEPQPARQGRDIRSAFCCGQEKGHSQGVALLSAFLGGGGPGPSRTFGLQPRRSGYSQPLPIRRRALVPYLIRMWTESSPEKTVRSKSPHGNPGAGKSEVAVSWWQTT